MISPLIFWQRRSASADFPTAVGPASTTTFRVAAIPVINAALSRLSRFHILSQVNGNWRFIGWSGSFIFFNWIFCGRQLATAGYVNLNSGLQFRRWDHTWTGSFLQYVLPLNQCSWAYPLTDDDELKHLCIIENLPLAACGEGHRRPETHEMSSESDSLCTKTNQIIGQ